ncbi:unnamed protein product [Didymodactylos carnosus]|uniref:Uncharacterized protein n=1 Tax=Didymodactylos carnosus TaxID=1234261 RepID=A0A8S2HIQ9_9BILA|nr:unnamed protein product [Didymodactylos carnosus]CAF3649173.1 unnamed protein product [Didymodactylos carnosus]
MRVWRMSAAVWDIDARGRDGYGMGVYGISVKTASSTGGGVVQRKSFPLYNFVWSPVMNRTSHIVLKCAKKGSKGDIHGVR